MVLKYTRHPLNAATSAVFSAVISGEGIAPIKAHQQARDANRRKFSPHLLLCTLHSKRFT